MEEQNLNRGDGTLEPGRTEDAPEVEGHLQTSPDELRGRGPAEDIAVGEEGFSDEPDELRGR